MLACGSSDGSISVLSHRTESPNEWRVERFEAHTPGVLAVSWAPSTSPAALVQSGGAPNVAPPRLVSGGCDGLVKIWKPKTTDPSQGPGWECDAVLKEHNDWVRDVAWAPSIGLPTTSIASASQVRVLKIVTRTVTHASPYDTGRHSSDLEQSRSPHIDELDQKGSG